MEAVEAINMFSHTEFHRKEQETWIDLGCGRGTFTQALANVLGPGSTIYAMDKSETDLKSIPDKFGSTSIIKLHGDFLDDSWPSDLDGILMANALHFVQDKETFIKRAKSHLNTNGFFLMVEYEMQKSNPWVPYPLGLVSAEKLFLDAGFSSVKKLSERPSAFNGAMMYSAIIKIDR